jgi:copper(I)-binding protein
MRKLGLALTIATIAATLPLIAQTHEGHAAAAPGKTMTNAQKIKLALSAGPADITKDATVMDMGADGKMVELRKGTNGWMCMAQPEAMCLDKEWQGWANAWM